MIRRFGLSALLTAVAGLVLAAPSSSFGATTLGQTFVPMVGNTCNGGPDWEVIQTGRASGPSYAAPTAGVLTSWSYEAGVQQTTLTMRAFHPTGTPHEYKVIADAGLLQVVPPSSGLHTFGTRVPVEAGDLVGIHSTTGICGSFGAPGDTYDYRFGTATPVGTSNPYTMGSGFIEDIAARLEPDADHDLYGDETQDQCPTNAATQGPCPVTPVTTAKKKKCKKKKHKRSAESAKKKKCKKKKRR